MKIICATLFLLVSFFGTSDAQLDVGAETICASGVMTSHAGFDTVTEYSSNLNDMVTLCPNPGFTAVSVEFTYFVSQSNDCFPFPNAVCVCVDKLQIFLSDTVGMGELVAPEGDGWCNDDKYIPPIGSGDLETFGPIVSTHPSGCLTFLFQSNADNQKTGFSATVDCETGSEEPTDDDDDECTFTLLNFWFQWIFCLLSLF